MPHATRYNRTKEVAQPILEKVMQAQASGNLPISFAFSSPSVADYIKGRIYAAWRALQREAKEANMEPPEFPTISIKQCVLVFKRKQPLEYAIVQGDVTQAERK